MKRYGKVGGVDTSCPQWCASGIKEHRQALEEGCSGEEARTHMSADLGWVLDDVRNHRTGDLLRLGGGGWRVMLERAEMRLTSVTLWLHRPKEGTSGYENLGLNLTTGEARRLAAQLVRLADMEELADD